MPLRTRRQPGEKLEAVVEKLDGMRLKLAPKKVKGHIDETLTYYDFPSAHWVKIRTNNPLERTLRKVRRRTQVV